MPPKPVSIKSSSSNGTETAPVLVNQRKAPPETNAVHESRRKASDDWNEAEKAIKRVLKNSEVYSQMDEFIQDYAVLKKTADLNKKKIEDLENHGKLQLDEFAQQYKEWQKKEMKLISDVENVEKNSRNTYSEKVDDLEADLETTRKEKLSLQSQLATIRQDCKEAKDELEVWRKKIQRYEQDLAQLDDTALETQ
jgi:chromosome segregation ATPase